MQLENLFPTGRYGTDGTSFVYKPADSKFDVVLANLVAGVWTLTAAGTVLAATNSAANLDDLSRGATGGTKTGATVSAIESYGEVNRTVLTLAALPQAIVNTSAEYAGTLIYTFPEGRILLLGALASVAQTTTTTIATSIAAGATGAFALGTAAASATSLASTMVNILPSTAYTSSATIAVQAAVAKGALVAAAQFDGTTTPVPVFFNSAIATGSIDGAQTWNGTVTLVWINLGDY